MLVEEADQPESVEVVGSEGGVHVAGPAATMASADPCRPVPTPPGGASTPAKQGQAGRPPRVRRATFIPHTRRIYAQTLRVTSGFGSLGPLAQSLNASYAVPVGRAGTLLTASFRPRLATTPLLFG